MEWTSEWNPFNSIKALAWRESFEAIARGEIPPPVSTTLDACNACNLNCTWCQYKEYRAEHPDFMTEEDLLWAADAIKELGAVSCCALGGGDGAVHPSAGVTIRRLKDNGIHVGVITNGVYADRFMDDILYSLDWIGCSIDAASPDNYAKLKGGTTTDFFSVINNIKQIVRKRKNGIPTVSFKFLLHPENYHEILDATKLAKSIGCDQIHIRPAYGSRDSSKPLWYPDMIQDSLKSIEKAQKLETASFHVYGIMHKYEKDFDKVVLDKCEVTPIAGLTFAADGYCYVCCLPKGARIDTNNGIKTIEKIKKGDIVLTHKSNYRKVLRTFKRDTQELIHITSYGWFEDLIATPEHPILAVKKRDRYCEHVGKHCPATPNWKKCLYCNEHKEFKPEFINIEELEKNDYIFTPVDNTTINDTVNLTDFYKNKRHNYKLQKYSSKHIELDDDICWLIGLYLAEGNILKHQRPDDYITGLQFSLGLHEKNMAEKAVKIIDEKLKIKPKINYIEDHNVIQIQIFSAFLGEIFKNMCNEYSHKKKLDNIFMKLPTYMQEQILWGWCDGDGFHRKEDNTYHITTTSKELLYQMWRICLRCGYSPTTYDWKVLGSNRKQAYTLFLSPDKHKRGFVFLWKNYLVSLIKTVEKKQVNTDVYNIEVEEDNSYVANSIAVHNCDLRGEDQGRMCKWHDILDYWGSDEHKELLKNLDPQKCPYRCTYNFYEEILNKVFREDRMSYLFP